MIINIIDRDFNFLGQVDDYESLIMTKKWHGIGGFELHLHENNIYTDKLIKGNIIAKSKQEKVIEPIGESIEIIEDWQGTHEGTQIEDGKLKLITTPYLEFGGGGSATVPHNNIFNITDAITISVRIRIVNDGTGTYGQFMQKNNAFAWFLGIRPRDGFTVWYSKMNGGINNNWLIGGFPELVDGKWHNVVFTYDKNAGENNQKFYIDGELRNQKTTTGTFDTSTDPLSLVTSSFKGGFRDARIYNRQLTDNEVMDLFEGKTVTDGLVGHWAIDEGTGNIAYDSSPYTNNGTISGATWGEITNNEGVYISNAIDLSEVGIAKEGMVSWEGEGAKVEVRISKDSGRTWSEWEEINSTIPQLNNVDVRNTKLQYKITLTKGIADVPYISNLITSVETKEIERIKTSIDSKKAYIILHREINSTTGGLVIKGLELKSYLARWLVFPPSGHAYYRVNSNVETIIKEYVTSTLQRKGITNIVVAENQNRGITTVYQSRYKNLADELEKLSLASGLGWDIVLDLDNKQFVFEVYEGQNRTANQNILPPAIFSIEYDNIVEQTLIDSRLNYANTAIVAGQGEGVDRKIEIVGDIDKGLDSFEIFVDARDIENEGELSVRGWQKLAEVQEVFTFDSRVSTDKNLIYEEDFELGDIVTIQNKKWNVTADRRITEVTEIYEKDGFKLDVTFGESIPTIKDVIKQATDTPIAE